MDESTVISGTSGDDSLEILTTGTIYGHEGNDTINIKSKNVFAEGNSGNDLFVVNAYYSASDLTDITITGGEGKDTIQFRPDTPYSNNLEIIVTDFSSDDVIRFDGSDYYYGGEYFHRILTQEVEYGNVVISDNASIGSDSDTSVSVEPKFRITLQGVSDISQVANAKYYRYSYGTLSESKTLGELFNVEVDETSESVQPVTISPTETLPTNETIYGGASTDTIVAPVTISGDIGATVPTVITYGDSTATIPATITTAGGDSAETVLAIDNTFLGGGGGDTIINGPVVVDSNVEGGIGNTYYVTVNVGSLEITNNYYTYEGGYRFLQNYNQGEVIKLVSDYQGIDFFGDNFIVKSSTGQLEIANARDKVISYSGPDGAVVAYSYFASSGSNINGSARYPSQIDILIGADYQNNRIAGGYGSSSLWGGNGGNDTLIGGSSYNEFFYFNGSGNDVIQNAYNNDLVNLFGISASQINGLEVNIGQVNINFIDGGSLQVNGDSSVRYQVAEGTFAVNQYTKEWSYA